MSGGPAIDWLDRLARRAAGGSAGGMTDGQPVVAPGEERYSRDTAVKFALAGAASLAFGLWKVPPLYAEKSDDCFRNCFDAINDYLNEQIQSCNNVYEVRGEPNSWKRVKSSLQGYPLIGWVVVKAWLYLGCIERANANAKRAKDLCYKDCEERCRKPQARSPQGASSSARPLCEVTPRLPKSPPPTYPPPPSPAQDPCWACATVGGYCCPPCPGTNAAPCLTVLPDKRVLGNCEDFC